MKLVFPKLAGRTHPPSFSQAEFAAKKKTTRREKFLLRLESVIPWVKLPAVIEPFYPKGERGRPPVGLQRMKLIDKIGQFIADEKAAAVIEPSRDGMNGGGSGGTIFDDNGATLGRTPYIAEKRVKLPVVVAAIESYGRLYRLAQAHAPVSVELDVETKFTGDHEHGFDTVDRKSDG